MSRASSTSNAVRAPKGFLRVKCNGGINQMRQQICDAVAIAHHLEVSLTLVFGQSLDSNTASVMFDRSSQFNVTDYTS